MAIKANNIIIGDNGQNGYSRKMGKLSAANINLEPKMPKTEITATFKDIKETAINSTPKSTESTPSLPKLVDGQVNKISKYILDMLPST